MPKEKLYLVISFLLNVLIGLGIYTMKLEVSGLRQEIIFRCEILEEKIKSSKYAKLTCPKTRPFPETNPFVKNGEEME